MLEIFLLRNIMVFVACRNSTCFQKLNIIVYFLTCSYSISFLKMCDNTFENMRSRDIQIRKCEWSHGCKMTQSKSPIIIVNYFTCMQHFSCRWYRPPEVDLNGYPRICNPYCCDIQIRRCEWTQGKKMTQSKSPIKNSKLFYMYAALLL